MADPVAVPGATPEGESSGAAPAGGPEPQGSKPKEGGDAPPVVSVVPPGEVPVRDRRYWRDEFFRGRNAPPAKTRPATPVGDAPDDGAGETPPPVGQDMPDLKKAMDEYFTERFGPAFETLQSHATDSMVDTFLARPENTHFRQHEARAREFAKHAAYAQVPIDLIFQALDYPNAVARGASQGQRAGTRAEARRLPGSTTRQPIAGTPDFAKMSKKEIEEFNAKVRTGLVVKPEEE